MTTLPKTSVDLVASKTIIANGRKLGRVQKFVLEANIKDIGTKVHLTFNLGTLVKDADKRKLEKTYTLKAGSLKIDKKPSADPNNPATADTISFETIEPLDLPF